VLPCWVTVRAYPASGYRRSLYRQVRTWRRHGRWPQRSVAWILGSSGTRRVRDAPAADGIVVRSSTPTEGDQSWSRWLAVRAGCRRSWWRAAAANSCGPPWAGSPPADRCPATDGFLELVMLDACAVQTSSGSLGVPRTASPRRALDSAHHLGKNVLQGTL